MIEKWIRCEVRQTGVDADTGRVSIMLKAVALPPPWNPGDPLPFKDDLWFYPKGGANAPFGKEMLAVALAAISTRLQVNALFEVDNPAAGSDIKFLSITVQ